MKEERERKIEERYMQLKKERERGRHKRKEKRGGG